MCYNNTSCLKMELTMKTYALNSMSDSAMGSSENLESIEPGYINARASVNLIYYLK